MAVGTPTDAVGGAIGGAALCHLAMLAHIARVAVASPVGAAAVAAAHQPLELAAAHRGAVTPLEPRLTKAVAVVAEPLPRASPRAAARFGTVGSPPSCIAFAAPGSANPVAGAEIRTRGHRDARIAGEAGFA